MVCIMSSFMFSIGLFLKWDKANLLLPIWWRKSTNTGINWNAPLLPCRWQVPCSWVCGEGGAGLGAWLMGVLAPLWILFPWTHPCPLSTQTQTCTDTHTDIHTHTHTHTSYHLIAWVISFFLAALLCQTSQVYQDGRTLSKVGSMSGWAVSSN